jgi:hypothetical protein
VIALAVFVAAEPALRSDPLRSVHIFMGILCPVSVSIICLPMRSVACVACTPNNQQHSKEMASIGVLHTRCCPSTRSVLMDLFAVVCLSAGPAFSPPLLSGHAGSLCVAAHMAKAFWSQWNGSFARLRLSLYCCSTVLMPAAARVLLPRCAERVSVTDGKTGAVSVVEKPVTWIDRSKFVDALLREHLSQLQAQHKAQAQQTGTGTGTAAGTGTTATTNGGTAPPETPHGLTGDALPPLKSRSSSTSSVQAPGATGVHSTTVPLHGPYGRATIADIVDNVLMGGLPVHPPGVAVAAGSPPVVTAQAFGDFLKLFGPFVGVLDRVADSVLEANGQVARWFHGVIEREQSLK